ncbi:MAG: response regulator transcription factor [Firmicutes bacterium]|nr:response regulator transcription factor [Bacillota bacterium]
MKILLAEDERELSDVLVALFNAKGFEVDLAENGKQALELSQKNSYDIMVLDVMMPVMDGIEALKEMRLGGNTTPVIMLTAKSQVDDRVEGLDAGADDYLTKPFSVKELFARINSLARRQGQYTPKKLSLGSVTLNKEESELIGVNTVRLAVKELEMMELFMLNKEKELQTKDIYFKLWEKDEDADESIVWVYISFLRDKLKAINADIAIEGEKNGSFKLVRV